MTLSTQISPLVPAAPVAPPQPAAAAPAVSPVQPDSGAQGAGTQHLPHHPPTQHQHQRRGPPAPEAEARPATEAQARVAAMIEVAGQLAGRANAAGGGAGRAAQLARLMSAAAARQGLELRGALLVAEDERAVLGAGSVYHEGALIASFIGSRVSYYRSPRRIDFQV